MRYGGNTPCVEVRTDAGGLVILDAGTGIRELGRALLVEAGDGAIRGEIFVSHAHWDHLQGLPFFAPLYRESSRFLLRVPGEMLATVTRAVREQMSPGLFPVSYDELDGRLRLDGLPPDGVRGAGYELRAFAVQHPGGAAAYRLTGGNGEARALVYISDNELAGGHVGGSLARWREELVAFARGASVLVHDATYTEEEYHARQGWGHSTDLQAVELALEADVERLVLFHHAPERTDDEVDARVIACETLVRSRGKRLRVLAASEGMVLTI